MRLVKRGWVALVVALILAVAGLSVSHLREMFGAQQRNRPAAPPR